MEDLEDKMQWHASWIWDGGDPAPVNAYRIFRKTFALPGGVTGDNGTAFVCADTRYQLIVNGRSVARGPAPNAPGVYSFDELDVRHHLRPGEENTIVVIVHYIGAPVFNAYRHRGGLLFQMGAVVSDGTWLVAKQSPWLADTPRLTVQQGWTEHYDARREYADPIEPGDWAAATVVCPAEGGAWPVLEARGIPQQAVAYRPIARLMEWGNCSPAPADTVAGQMTEEALRPLTHGTVERSSDVVTLTPGGADIYLLYDFGEEVSGFLDLDVEGPLPNPPPADGERESEGQFLPLSLSEGGGVGEGASPLVDIGYDETLRVGETLSGLKHDWGTNCDIRYADRLLMRDGEQTFQNFSPRAFRFVRLAFRNLTRPVTLTSIGVYESTYPVNRRGAFICSDARLNQIWEIGRRTLQLCMDDTFMDCPGRERAQWVGDALVEAWGAALCFGDTRLLARMLRTQAAAQYADGRLDPTGPGEWDAHAPNTPIPGFMCLWVRVLADYFTLSGDAALCAALLPNAERVLRFLSGGKDGLLTNKNGLLTNVPGWNFIDWAPGLSGGMDESTDAGCCAPVNAQYADALSAVAEVARAAGQHETAECYEKQAEDVRAAWQAAFWDEERGLYRDTADGDTFSQHTQSLSLLYGLAGEARQAQVLDALLHDTSLVQIGSPYFSFYLLGALNRQGRHADALDYIRRHWGAMLDAGATSWWENYHGRDSLCHAWSCGPTVDLLTQTLGLTPAAPGWEVVNICPRPADLTWAKGVVPTPHGDVSVHWHKTADAFHLHISAPRSVTVRPVLPVPPGAVVTVNGAVVNRDVLGDLPGGGHEIVVSAT